MSTEKNPFRRFITCIKDAYRRGEELKEKALNNSVESTKAGDIGRAFIFGQEYTFRQTLLAPRRFNEALRKRNPADIITWGFRIFPGSISNHLLGALMHPGVATVFAVHNRLEDPIKRLSIRVIDGRDLVLNRLKQINPFQR